MAMKRLFEAVESVWLIHGLVIKMNQVITGEIAVSGLCTKFRLGGEFHD